MIPKNELRVGNFVMIPCASKDHVREVKNIYSEGINGFYSTISEDEYIDASFEELEPIPLIPELLVKCGFVEGSACDYKCLVLDAFEVVTLIGHKDGAASLIFQDGEFWEIRYIVERIESLHQLQNIYFFLKGQELEINLIK